MSRVCQEENKQINQRYLCVAGFGLSFICKHFLTDLEIQDYDAGG